MESKEYGRPGADLIFLSEFPIGLLSDRSAEMQSVTFELKERGKRPAKQWTIHASASFGMPNYVDMQLFIICLAYTQEQGFPEQVHFCRHRMLQDLGWSRGQENYDRLQLGLDRLVATTYTAINHYPDPKGRACVKRMAFHLMEAYQIHDSRFADAELPPSWFRWSEEVHRLLHTRQLTTLDLEVFRTLKRPVSQAMYRYLHTRHLDGKPKFEENLVEYACERLGLSRDFRWASDLKRTLNEGHKELIEKGLIAGATYERMRAQTGERPQQKVVIHYSMPESLPAPSSSLPAPPAVEDPLLRRLVEAGLTRGVADELVSTRREVVERQLAYWPHRQKIQNPGAALRRAIEEDWAAPEGWKQAQKREQAPLKARQRRAQEQVEAEAGADEARAFDDWWATLPAPQRAALTQQAQAELLGDSQVLAQHYQRHPDRLHEALRPLLQQLAGWRPGS
jgi:hypothetical protein